MIYRTTHRRLINQPEIVFDWALTAPEHANWLVTYFEEATLQGTVFQPDQTVQVGWIIVMLRETDTGDLEIWEPDFDALPIRWIRGVNNLFRHLLLQKSVCEAMEVTPDFPSLRDSGIVSQNFLASSQGVMSRDLANGTDSGWVFYPHDYQDSEGQHVSLYEITLAHEWLIPFVALPPSSKVSYSKARIVVESGTKTASSDDCELLRNLLNAPGMV